MYLYETAKDDFFISTDKSKLNIELIHSYLSNESYWAKNIPLETVRRSIENSFCFGVYKKTELDSTVMEQVGFTRVITDHATFGYLADVFILEKYRGLGLATWLMEEIMNCEVLQGFRSWMLATRDAHLLYERFGFGPLEKPERFMRLAVVANYPAP
jgi:GNAT superfamily N-acetyltransferase